MKRTPLKRKKPMKRRAARPRRKKTAIILPDYLASIRRRPCLICKGDGSQPHHVIHRGAYDAFRDDRTCVPLCWKHHTEVHTIGKKTFEKKHEIDLTATYKQLWKDYDSR